MIIVLKRAATEKQAQHIVDTARGWGLKANVSRGVERTIIGLIGDERELRDKPLGVISEGERARVLLARVLIAEPELLCLDEPAAGLDLGAREELVVRLGELFRADRPAPALLVTHHLEELPEHMTHALVLRQGAVVAAGPIEEALTSETISRAFDLAVEVTRHGGGRYSARASR